ncbi:uncharacterized protein ELE39_003082 [Cryptosporidium sp. chipmunk genotype I]|uniref:uncharacterized protein n=1 Tax=Cryptosporidium sp. chipmunk genotype I TaxID=1280935 RepID=UPI00351A48B3|nr:hypothetical protein ELE39_003082 [Cryptosporidium sp. chipmunk genotype I]
MRRLIFLIFILIEFFGLSNLVIHNAISNLDEEYYTKKSFGPSLVKLKGTIDGIGSGSSRLYPAPQSARQIFTRSPPRPRPIRRPYSGIFSSPASVSVTRRRSGPWQSPSVGSTSRLRISTGNAHSSRPRPRPKCSQVPGPSLPTIFEDPEPTSSSEGSSPSPGYQPLSRGPCGATTPTSGLFSGSQPPLPIPAPYPDVLTSKYSKASIALPGLQKSSRQPGPLSLKDQLFLRTQSPVSLTFEPFTRSRPRLPTRRPYTGELLTSGYPTLCNTLFVSGQSSRQICFPSSRIQFSPGPVYQQYSTVWSSKTPTFGLFTRSNPRLPTRRPYTGELLTSSYSAACSSLLSSGRPSSHACFPSSRVGFSQIPAYQPHPAL